jgi:hypothetical protein
MYNVGTYEYIILVCIGIGIAVYGLFYFFDARRFYTPTL